MFELIEATTTSPPNSTTPLLLKDVFFALLVQTLQASWITRASAVLDGISPVAIAILYMLENNKTDRDFIQIHGIPGITRSNYFEGLASQPVSIYSSPTIINFSDNNPPCYLPMMIASPTSASLFKWKSGRATVITSPMSPTIPAIKKVPTVLSMEFTNSTYAAARCASSTLSDPAPVALKTKSLPSDAKASKISCAELTKASSTLIVYDTEVQPILGPFFSLVKESFLTSNWAGVWYPRA